MVEHPPPKKNDEADPLLKVESGAGDGGRAPTVPMPSRWNVTCTPRKSFIDRWPELFSACWMAGMLLGVFALIIYGLGSLGVIRRPPLFVMNCNDSRPANEVHYHYIIEEGIDVPFDKLSKYLTFMRTEYPGLHYNVIFLINNIKGYRRTSQYKRDDQMRDLRSFRNFHLKYHNISVTVITLTKYLAETPWRYKWRKINLSFLTFYLRVYTVWKKGGIGMRLGMYSDLRTLRLIENPAVNTILRKYSNNGINPEEYSDALNKFYRDEQNEFISLFYGMVHQLLNETRSFINRSLTFSEDRLEKDMIKPHVRSHRNKRELNENSNSSDLSTNEREFLNNTNEKVDTYQNSNKTLESNHNNLLLSIFEKVDPWLNETGIWSDAINGSKNLNASELKVRIPLRNDSGSFPQVLIFYDFSILSEAMGPAYLSSEIVEPPNFSSMPSENWDEPELPPLSTPKRNSSHTLTIALDGSFIASTGKNHPFLGHIISTACQRMTPRFAIQDAVLTQCSSILNDNEYCGNIFLI